MDNTLDHHLQLDASRVVHLDGNAIPLGDFIDTTDTIFDFKNARKIGTNWTETQNLCGSGALLPFQFRSCCLSVFYRLHQVVKDSTTVGFTTRTRVAALGHHYGVKILESGATPHPLPPIIIRSKAEMYDRHESGSTSPPTNPLFKSILLFG